MSRLLDPERAEMLMYNAQKIYGVNPIAKGNERPNVWCRTAISVILKKEGNTLMSIGQFLYKNHATIMHGLAKHHDNLIYDKEYRMFFKEFEVAIKNPESSSPYILKNLKHRITEIILTLKALGYDEKRIDNFFEECIQETKLKIA
jgi:hypothetical protein